MEIKGTAVKSIKDWVKEEYTNEYNKWFEALPPASKDIFGGLVDSTDWYPINDGAKTPTEIMAKLFFNNDIDKGGRAAGRYSADKALKGVYKIFVMAANPSYIIKRASRIFSTYYRPCEMKLVSEEKKGVVLEISKLPQRYLVIEGRIAGWCHRALELSGCKDVKVESRELRKDTDGTVVELKMSWS